MTGESWQSRLDRFAACLAEQRTALEQGRPQDVRQFAPGPVAEPLPARLADRARRLQAEAQSVEADVRAALDGTGRQLRLLAVLTRDAGQPSAGMFDRSA